MSRPLRAVAARAVRGAGLWVVHAALWLVLTWSTGWAELLVGAAAATVGTYVMAVVEFRHLAPWAPRARWLAQAWRLPWYAVTGTLEILGVLARHLVGRPPAPSLVFAIPYAVDGDDDASATARALATAYTTITPNFIVLGVERGEGRCLMFVHQLRESPTPKMTRALGALA